MAPSGASYLPQWAGVRLRRVRQAFGPGCPSWDQQMEMIDWELRNEPSYQIFWSATPGNAFKILRTTFGKGQQYDG